jgi:hypothetical protein
MTFSTRREKRNANKVLVEECENNRPLGRTRHRCEDNRIKLK